MRSPGGPASRAGLPCSRPSDDVRRLPSAPQSRLDYDDRHSRSFAMTLSIVEVPAMPMIDIYAPKGTFADAHDLATRAAATVMRVEAVPDIPMFRENTAAFVHELPESAISDVAGSS